MCSSVMRATGKSAASLSCQCHLRKKSAAYCALGAWSGPHAIAVYATPNSSLGQSVIGCILSVMPDVTVCCFAPRGRALYVMFRHGRGDTVVGGGGAAADRGN